MENNKSFYPKRVFPRLENVSQVKILDDIDKFDIDDWVKHLNDTKNQVLAEYSALKEQIDSDLKDEQIATFLDTQFSSRDGKIMPSDIQSLEMRAVAIVSIMANRISWQLYAERPEDKANIELYSRIYNHANILITETASHSDRQTYYRLKK